MAHIGRIADCMGDEPGKMKNPLENKNIVLGVTGSIAAYKAVELASKLTQAGALVEVILTPSAEKFVTALTFQSVTGRKAYTEAELWGREGHVTHVGLGSAADLLVIAPASANTIAKLANGIGDTLLSLTALVARCPLVVAPAMDAGMYSHPATQKNVEILKERGASFIGPAVGHLASGLVGPGRFVEPLEIMGHMRWMLSQDGLLSGKHIVVTAGGTQEAIDPVRMISNRSSGRQGYAIAQAALDTGAKVTLISGPTCLSAPIGAASVKVRTADEMLKAVLKEARQAQVLIMAAAVADFKPAQVADQKIKKASNLQEIHLERTQDILLEISRQRKINGYPQRIIGFAAESQHLVSNARTKLEEKSLDLIVANDISAQDAGFDVETNKVSFIFPDGHIENLPLMEKTEVAQRVLDQVTKWF
jgi:phosphopantothenoylcysteine decarboxylase/phosphopantothenate--cysteine ligase